MKPAVTHAAFLQAVNSQKFLGSVKHPSLSPAGVTRKLCGPVLKLPDFYFYSLTSAKKIDNGELREQSH